MSQHDLDIANQGFPATRSDLNLALKALGSSNSGATAPSTTYANQLWYDTANNILKIRNEDNDAWISLFTLDQSADNIEALTVNGTVTVDQLDSDNIRIDGNTISSTDTNGNVTIDPAGTGETVIDSSVRITKTSGAPTLLLTDNDTSGDGTIDASDGNLRFYSDNDQEVASSLMGFYVDGSEAMRIDSSGNVGIGGDIDNHGGYARCLQITGAGESAIELENSTGYSFIAQNAANLQFKTVANGSQIFYTNNIERMRVTNGGALLINQTTNPAGNMFRVTETAGNACTSRAANSAYSFQQWYSSAGGDLEYNIRGDGNAYADGSWNGGGADYAEFFEWDDGNASDEDRRGYSVVLVNNKIRKATSSDTASDIIGVVSANPSVVGDTGWNNWSGKYLRDDFSSYVTETYTSTKWSEDVTDEDGTVRTEQRDYETDKIPSDVTVPDDAVVHTVDDAGNTLTRRRLNPDYDETLTYVSREDRQEWDAIGMMGKLRLRAGQPTGDRWIKMRDIATDDDGNVTVEEWLVR